MYVCVFMCAVLPELAANDHLVDFWKYLMVKENVRIQSVGVGGAGRS